MTTDHIGRLPKAVLHDHLDGGNRPETLLELASAVGHELPESDPESLRRWFLQDAAGTLEQYLEAFRHTVAVMQTASALERTTYEAVLDHAADGVVYAELRFAPSLHTDRGLSREEVLEAALLGWDQGRAETGMVGGLIVTAMRNADDSDDVARLAVSNRDRGVVGFDLAGPEVGFPLEDHIGACRIAAEGGLGITLHAGEADGPHSVWAAVARCRAHRVGHGVRIVEDTGHDGGSIHSFGPVGAMVRDLRVCLEVSITSNVHSGQYPDTVRHPFGMLHEAGFAVTINTDNRLMSGITVGDELELAHTTFGLTIEDLGRATERAIAAGFGPWTDRRRLIADVVAPAYGL